MRKHEESENSRRRRRRMAWLIKTSRISRLWFCGYQWWYKPFGHQIYTYRYTNTRYKYIFRKFYSKSTIQSLTVARPPKGNENEQNKWERPHRKARLVKNFWWTGSFGSSKINESCGPALPVYAMKTQNSVFFFHNSIFPRIYLYYIPSVANFRQLVTFLLEHIPVKKA